MLIKNKIVNLLTKIYIKYENQLPTTNYQLPTTDYQLPTTNYQLPTTNYQKFGAFVNSLFILLSLFSSSLFFGQTSSGVGINFSSQVGCQTYANEPERDKFTLFLTDISSTNCIRVCENSQITYTLFGNLAPSPNTIWIVTGGIIINQTPTTCTIAWGSNGAGQLKIKTLSTTGLIDKTICFTKIINPKASFNIFGNLTPDKPFLACIDQIVTFLNTSTSNSGPDLVTYLWDFGDGTTSSMFQPSHQYATVGDYDVTLTVFNSCYCSSVIKINIRVGNPGFEINCPSIVCDGQTATYNIPANIAQLCGVSGNWVVVGGSVTSQTPNTVNVNWNQVNETGFGSVTFDPFGCNLDCTVPTTIKIPVIKTIGTIVGSPTLCLGQQSRYKLPQWPSTDFHWEIVGNVANNLGVVLLTDQRNEVIVSSNVSTPITLRATYQNSLLGCGGSAIFVISSTPNNEIFGNNLVCKNYPVSYNVATGTTTNWELKNDQNIVISSLLNSNTFNYTFNNAGNYTLSVPGSSQCVSTPKLITVVPTPNRPTIVNGELTICPNAPYTYSISGNNANNRYRWEVTNGTFVGTNLGNQVVINFNNNATHEIKIYNETLNPIICTSPPLIINVNNIIINAEISSANGVICANSTNNTYQVNQFGTSNLFTAGEVYTWTISPATAGSITTGQGTNSIAVAWNNVIGTSTIAATLSLSIKKCTLPLYVINKSIIIRPLPTISINATVNGLPNNVVCGGSQIVLSLSSNIPLINPTTVQVKWDFGNGSSITQAGTSYVFTPANLSAISNIFYNVTASIVSPNGCLGTSISLPLQVTVLPTPVATLSIASGGNIFCPPTNPINTLLSAATSGVGTTIVWYRNSSGIITALGSGVQLQLNQSFGYGEYYFIATNTNLCSRRSNSIFINELCLPPSPCTIVPTPQVVNNSTVGCGIYSPTTLPEDCNCANINFSGTAPGALFTSWRILGPFVNTTVTDASFQVSNPGIYQTFFKTNYICQNNGAPTSITVIKSLTVPYIARFGYTTQCNGNNTFTVKVYDDSGFLQTVTNRTYQYAYRLTGATTWINSITTANGTITPNLSAGSYQIRLNIRGTLNGVLQNICAKQTTVVIATIPTQTIAITQVAYCNNTAVRFKVNGSQIGDTYLWTFEPGTLNQATNTQPEPSRVFSSAGTKTVGCVVTNKYGCSRTLPSINVVVPQPCFSGDVVATPPSASVCNGNNILLQYVSNSAIPDNCTVGTYTWMNGIVPVAGAPNLPSLLVSTPGFYWLKLLSPSPNNCKYNTNSRITPIFRPEPTLNIGASQTTCFGTPVLINAQSNATNFTWTIDGVVDSSLNNQASITLNTLAIGAHTVSCLANINGCTKIETITITVLFANNTLGITAQLRSCNPYKIELIATGSGSFSWSNGMIGSIINVFEGGPYVVTSTNGTCTNTFQIDLPKNPDQFLWVFPSGCYSNCANANNVVLGPIAPVRFYEYDFNNTSFQTSSGFVDPLTLLNNGSYNLEINNSLCSKKSEDLNYTQVPCDRCYFEVISNVITRNNTSLCSFNMQLNITNPAPSVNPTITVPNGEVIVSPSSFNLNTGLNSLNFNIIPVNGFNGGLVIFEIRLLQDGKPCLTTFSVNVPPCSAAKGSKNNAIANDFNNNDYSISPNPANNFTNIKVPTVNSLYSVAIYDLLGKEIITNNNFANNLVWELDTTKFATGVYVVVFKLNNEIVVQKKLIIQ